MPDGKICYIEIPATDVDASAKFYADVFAWQSRSRGDGSRAFDDTTGAVSGTWVLGRKPQRESTMLDRKSTRLNSSHTVNSYAVVCFKKNNKEPAAQCN